MRPSKGHNVLSEATGCRTKSEGEPCHAAKGCFHLHKQVSSTKCGGDPDFRVIRTSAHISRNLPVGEQAYRQLTELYRALRLYVNCFQPSMKLLSKQRDGKKVRCVYDPAKTPLQRLLLSGVLPVQKQQELTEVAQALDPVRLLQQLEQLQQALFRCAVSCSPFVPNPPPALLRVFSVDDCTAGKLPVEGSVPDGTAGVETLYREQER